MAMKYGILHHIIVLISSVLRNVWNRIVKLGLNHSKKKKEAYCHCLPILKISVSESRSPLFHLLFHLFATKSALIVFPVGSCETGWTLLYSNKRQMENPRPNVQQRSCFLSKRCGKYCLYIEENKERYAIISGPLFSFVLIIIIHCVVLVEFTLQAQKPLCGTFNIAAAPQRKIKRYERNLSVWQKFNLQGQVCWKRKYHKEEWRMVCCAVTYNTIRMIQGESYRGKNTSCV